MASYSRQLLSGSTNGKPIQIAVSVTPGTVIHTAVSGVTAFDELYVWVVNTSGSAVLITTEFGATGVPGSIGTSVSIPASSGPIPLLTGQVIQNGLIVAIFAATINVINAFGFVNRIQ